MNQIFTANNITLNLQAHNKTSAINEIVDLLNNNNILNDKEQYKTAILKRELESTTGIGFGIAIPHAKSDAVNQAAVAIAVSPAGVDFESADNTPVKIIFMIAVPNDANDMHLQILAKLSRKLINPVFRNQLINSQSAEELLTYLTEI
ncbi:PTS sugar transporter subunit IIA [Pectinatus brassicae]|uniref:PTS system fructose-specific IIC component n=1 Tax=Pectinatus brassicae TaxID=862415 RepID=A0A840UIS8_9FIRM|nr:PTS sugar transporter subunit IIA [Pectinatus brassicae]MBB5335507.1 PTS system fructose-specific IIC component [Pectinatus brassicae]